MEYRRGSKINNFTDLEAWKIAHNLVLEVYKLVKLFPNEERFGLSLQLRRAAVSISSNIAEGFKRETYKEKARFYSMSVSSLSEVQNQLLIARDVGYLKNKDFQSVVKITIEVGNLTGGLFKFTKRKI